MADKKLLEQLADVPLAKPGFDALSLAAPLVVQGNPQGQWQTHKPNSLDEERLKAVVQHLVSTNAITSANSYCCQCALENKNAGLSSNYVPVIMMPIYPSDQCPFDIDGEIEKMKEDSKPSKGTQKTKGKGDSDITSERKKPGFLMQRLTDYHLLSQW